jgi:hypothetical protein
MSSGDPRYAAVNTGHTYPAITQAQALRYARKLVRHFGSLRFASSNVTRPKVLPHTSRRCWASTTPTTSLSKGWARMIHDCSHSVFRWRHPGFRPHDGGHAVLEREMRDYVHAQGWLEPAPLKPQADTTAPKRARLEATVARWERKLKLATTMLRKNRRRLAAFNRRHGDAS